MKKFLSFAIILCIFASVMTGFSVTSFAQEASDLTITYKNADTYEINLIFSEAIPAAADVGEYVTLTVDGEQISDLTFVYETNVAGKYPDATESERTLVIRPADGLDIDAMYKLTIDAALTNADGSKTLADDFVWEFKIIEIFSDDFESGSTEKWTPTANTTAAIETEDVLGGTKSLSVSSKGAWTYMSINEAYMPADSSEYSITYNYKAKAGTTYMSFYTDTLYGDKNAFQTNSYVSANMRLALWENGKNVLGSGKEASRGKGRVTLKDGIIRKYEGRDDGRYIREFEYVGTSLKSGKFTLAFRDANIRVIIDDILVTKVESFASSTLTVDGGLDNASVSTIAEIKFDYPVVQSEENEDCILVTEAGQPVYNYDISYSDDGKTVYLTFKNNLAYETDYTIEFTADFRFVGYDKSYEMVPHALRTCKAPFAIESIVLADGFKVIESPDELTSGELDIEATIINRSYDDPVTFFATVCLLNSNGMMCDIAGGTYTLAKGESAVITDTLTATGDDYTVKCLVWDSSAGMKKILSRTIE